MIKTFTRCQIPDYIKMIVFDMAGTTVNEKGIVYDTLHKTLNNFGVDITRKEIDKWHGYNKYEVLDYYMDKRNKDKMSDEIVGELKSQLRTNLNNNLSDAYSDKSNISLIDNKLPDLFEELKNKDVRIVLNTGYPIKIKDQIIRTLEMDKYIDDSISSEEVLKGRPYPYMINTLMKRGGIEYPKVVMKVGDTKADIQEGRVAHCCASIGVLTGVGTLKEFREVHADIVITSVMALEK